MAKANGYHAEISVKRDGTQFKMRARWDNFKDGTRMRGREKKVTKAKKEK